MAMMSNFHLIVSLSNSNFSQLLILYDVKGSTFVILDIEDQALRND